MQLLDNSQLKKAPDSQTASTSSFVPFPSNPADELKKQQSDPILAAKKQHLLGTSVHQDGKDKASISRASLNMMRRWAAKIQAEALGLPSPKIGRYPKGEWLYQNSKEEDVGIKNQLASVKAQDERKAQEEYLTTVIEENAQESHIPSTSTHSPSSRPVVNQLGGVERETFATRRPLEDFPDIQACKHCKKFVLKSALKSHLDSCLAKQPRKDFYDSNL
jgi:hypothetical protein